MNSIEHKLKIDAADYAIKPDSDQLKQIMSGIKKEPSAKESSRFNWPLPIGIAAATMSLVFVFYLVPVHKPDINVITNETTTPVQDINFNLFIQDFDTNLVSEIQTEQQAIANDLKYLKDLIALESTAAIKNT